MPAENVHFACLHTIAWLLCCFQILELVYKSLFSWSNFFFFVFYILLQEVPHHLIDILHPSEGMLLAGPDCDHLNGI